MNETIRKINELILRDEVRDYIEAAYSVKQKDYPFMSYFGVNYRNDEVLNLKIYFRYHNPLSDKDILKLLPENNTFLKYYTSAGIGKINDENHTGVTFAIKITPSGDVTYYFHYLVYDFECKIPLELPNRLKLAATENLLYQNIYSYEYTKEEQFKKKYFTITDKSSLFELLKRFKVEKEFRSLHHIEYTETEKFDKIILGIWEQEEQEDYMDSLPGCDMKSVIPQICKKYGLMTGSSSIYNDLKTRSVYFTLKDNSHFFSNMDTIENLKNTIFNKGIIL